MPESKLEHTPVFRRDAREQAQDDNNRNISSLSEPMNQHQNNTERVSRNEMLTEEFTLMDAYTPTGLERKRADNVTTKGDSDKRHALPSLPETVQSIVEQQISPQNLRKRKRSTPPDSSQTSFYLNKDKIQDFPTKNPAT